jgi:hypothetical protein
MVTSMSLIPIDVFLAGTTEYRVANSQSSFVVALCSKMEKSIGNHTDDLQEDGNQHSRQ